MVSQSEIIPCFGGNCSDTVWQSLSIDYAI